MNNTPNEIEHEGNTLVRLPRIEDAREGDYVMISGKLFPVSYQNKIKTIWIKSGISEEQCSFEAMSSVIQYAYREKKAGVHEWIDMRILCMINSPIKQFATPDECLKHMNLILSREHGSPAELMRKGAEEAIQLTDDDWKTLERNQRKTYAEGSTYDLLITQALANCRPKKERIIQ